VLVRQASRGEDAEQVAVLLGNGVQGALAAAGYRVVFEGRADIIADLGVTSEPLNARGTRVVYKGDADVAVTRAPELNAMSGQQMKDMVARNRFDVTGRRGAAQGAMRSRAWRTSSPRRSPPGWRTPV
jgi:2-keto-3-deoxy-L-rhamnonate aldolase RhmA